LGGGSATLRPDFAYFSKNVIGKDGRWELYADGSAEFSNLSVVIDNAGNFWAGNYFFNIDPIGNVSAPNLGTMSSQNDAPDSLQNYARVNGHWVSPFGGYVSDKAYISYSGNPSIGTIPGLPGGSAVFKVTGNAGEWDYNAPDGSRWIIAVTFDQKDIGGYLETFSEYLFQYIDAQGNPGPAVYFWNDNNLSIFDFSWPSGMTVSRLTADPEPVGSESFAGTSKLSARLDHVHKLPFPEIGLSPTACTYNGVLFVQNGTYNGYPVYYHTGTELSSLIGNNQYQSLVVTNMSIGPDGSVVPTWCLVANYHSFVGDNGTISSNADYSSTVPAFPWLASGRYWGTVVPLPSPLPSHPENVPSAGTSTIAARADHVHPLPYNQGLDTTSNVIFNAVDATDYIGAPAYDGGGNIINNPNVFGSWRISSDGSLYLAYGAASVDISGNLYANNIGAMASQADAPDTLHQYARINGSWVPVSGVSGAGGNPFDQSLNRGDGVTFESMSIGGSYTYLQPEALHVLNYTYDNYQPQELYIGWINQGASVNGAGFRMYGGSYDGLGNSAAIVSSRTTKQLIIKNDYESTSKVSIYSPGGCELNGNPLITDAPDTLHQYARVRGAWQITSGGQITSQQVTTALGYTPLNPSLVGASNGVASLDNGGKVPVSQLPSTVMEYLGVWSAANNSPKLTDGMTGVSGGSVYNVSAAGTVSFSNGATGASAATGPGANRLTFQVGDWVIYNGTHWQQSPASDEVISVNGYSGVVNLTTDNVTEGTTNQYFQQSRVLSTTLTGFTGASNTSVLASDTALVALEKLQTQINSRVSSDSTVTNIVKIGQAAYNALNPPNATTLYIIVGA